MSCLRMPEAKAVTKRYLVHATKCKLVRVWLYKFMRLTFPTEHLPWSRRDYGEVVDTYGQPLEKEGQPEKTIGQLYDIARNQRQCWTSLENHGTPRRQMGVKENRSSVSHLKANEIYFWWFGWMHLVQLVMGISGRHSITCLRKVSYEQKLVYANSANMILNKDR